jgi:hypothetical protein
MLDADAIAWINRRLRVGQALVGMPCRAANVKEA